MREAWRGESALAQARIPAVELGHQSRLGRPIQVGELRDEHGAADVIGKNLDRPGGGHGHERRVTTAAVAMNQTGEVGGQRRSSVEISTGTSVLAARARSRMSDGSTD